MKNYIFKNIAPYLFLFILILSVGISLLLQTDFHLVYTLDDPYIHLALAKNIWHGSYGINAVEFSAPSSSILWPFLLAPFSNFSFFEYIPLLINIAASFGTVWLFTKIFHHFPICTEDDKNTALTRIAICGLILISNQVGLIFTGMEHSLQVFLVVAIFTGVIIANKKKCLSSWLLLVIFLAPLIRYENLAISLPTLIYLFVMGNKRESLLICGLIFLVLAGFSGFLFAHGHEYLPNSILAKSAVADNGGSIIKVIGRIHRNIQTPIGQFSGVFFILLSLILVSDKRSRHRRVLAACLCLSIILHLSVGQYGWFFRYGVYIHISGILAVIYLYKEVIISWTSNAPLIKSACITTICIIALTNTYFMSIVQTPFASQEIYQQQYQMARFIKNYYKKPVAVNDLGLVALKGNQYVLDLWGLSSLTALKSRKGNTNSKWIVKLAEEHNIKLAMIYDIWFYNLPKEMKKVGELSFDGKRIVVGSKKVSFYAFDQQTFEEVSQLLIAYKTTLPKGASFTFTAENRKYASAEYINP